MLAVNTAVNGVCCTTSIQMFLFILPQTSLFIDGWADSEFSSLLALLAWGVEFMNYCARIFFRKIWMKTIKSTLPSSVTGKNLLRSTSVRIKKIQLKEPNRTIQWKSCSLFHLVIWLKRVYRVTVVQHSTVPKTYPCHIFTWMTIGMCWRMAPTCIRTASVARLWTEAQNEGWGNVMHFVYLFADKLMRIFCALLVHCNHFSLATATYAGFWRQFSWTKLNIWTEKKTMVKDKLTRVSQYLLILHVKCCFY